MYKLSPSDLTFLWDSCQRCFYLKVKHNIAYRGPFPGIFSTMANLTSIFYQGQSSSAISPDLPPGQLKYREKFVKSRPISYPGLESQAFIYGRFDAVIEFENGSYGLVDYKTSAAKEEQAAFYRRQLSAYAYALENPASGALALSPISRLGLFVISPERYEKSNDEEMVFVNMTTWVEVARDEVSFLDFVGKALKVLEAANLPESGDRCAVCTYRNVVNEFESGA